jgi:excisionase family DNA binding protein
MAGKSLKLPYDSSKHPLMSSQEAAKYLGMSRSTFHRRVVDLGMIGFLLERSTGRRRYRREDLDTYIQKEFDYCAPTFTVAPNGRTALSVRRHSSKARR